MIIKNIINDVCSYGAFAELSEDHLQAKIRQAIIYYALQQKQLHQGKYIKYHNYKNKLLDQYNKLKK